MEDSVNQAQDQPTCPTVVHEKVCIQAHVIITPHVDAGPSQSFCVGEAFIGTCDGEVRQTCEFDVSQEICVQVPLTFSATGTAYETGIVCGPKDIGECAGEAGCTHTIGFFKNHPGVTEDLLGLAGGTIVLGGLDQAGLPIEFSYVVDDITKAILVLEFQTPTAPSEPDLHQKYEQLYAQLLAAKLNVLNGASCQAAEETIAAADAFLLLPLDQIDTTELTNLIKALTNFNEGNGGVGCPGHCTGDL